MSNDNGSIPQDSILNINSEELVSLIVKLGFKKVGCYTCKFLERKKSDFKGTCNHPMALAIKVLSKEVRESQGGHSLPLFPFLFVPFTDDNGNKETLQLPAIVASEVGIASGSVMWPEHFDPMQIKICLIQESEITQD